MNPGRLNRKIQLQRQAGGLFVVDNQGNYVTNNSGERMTTSTRQDALGQEQDAWGLWKTRMARRMKSKGREAVGNAREHPAASVTFKLRYTSDLTAEDRLVDLTDGQAYDIEDWDGEQREGWMEIHCTRRRTPETANQGIS